jgi:hypothetical protein
VEVAAQRTGIKIDIPVKKTVEATTKNQDPIMDMALKYLKVAGIH